MSRGRGTGGTCRCFICHRNDAGSNRQRKSYIAAGITKDENGIYNGACFSKKQSHKIRRQREKKFWQNTVQIAY